jgi:hypothetical protein
MFNTNCSCHSFSGGLVTVKILWLGNLHGTWAQQSNESIRIVFNGGGAQAKKKNDASKYHGKCDLLAFNRLLF